MWHFININKSNFNKGIQFSSLTLKFVWLRLTSFFWAISQITQQTHLILLVLCLIYKNTSVILSFVTFLYIVLIRVTLLLRTLFHFYYVQPIQLYPALLSEWKVDEIKMLFYRFQEVFFYSSDVNPVGAKATYVISTL